MLQVHTALQLPDKVIHSSRGAKPPIAGDEHSNSALQVDQIVSLRSEALQLQESLRLALLDKAEGEGQLQILKDKIAAKNLEGERSAACCHSLSL